MSVWSRIQSGTEFQIVVPTTEKASGRKCSATTAVLQVDDGWRNAVTDIKLALQSSHRLGKNKIH